jgi:hypothetical protein
MNAGTTHTFDSQRLAAPPPYRDEPVDAMPMRLNFQAKAAGRLDRRALAAHPRGRATLGRFATLDRVYRAARRLWAPATALADERINAWPSVVPTPGSASDGVLAGRDARWAAPSPHSFWIAGPDVEVNVQVPTVAPRVAAAVALQPEQTLAWVGSRTPETGSCPDPLPVAASRWPRDVFSSVAQRVRYWTVSSGRQKEMRLERARDKVVGAAYVFLNAMQSDEPLDRHFEQLKRQVRRLDKHAQAVGGISEESARVLGEAATRTGGARPQAKDKMLSFHREALLHDIHCGNEFRHADAILLALESCMARSIAIYGRALRQLAYAGMAEDAEVDTVRRAVAEALAREAVADATWGEGRTREDGLPVAMRRLPDQTVMSLNAILSGPVMEAGASAGYRVLRWLPYDGLSDEAYTGFLAEVARVASKYMGRS